MIIDEDKKLDFLINYVLTRARTVDGDAEGKLIAEEAVSAWEIIKSCMEENKDGK